MKRITSSLLALLLALSMLIGMVPAAYAAPADTIESIDSTKTVDSSETEDVLDEAEEVAAQATEGTAVAEVNGNTYPDLKTAINAMSTGATLKLLDDVNLGTSAIGFYKSGTENLTFDLNGHTITSSYDEKGTVTATRNGLLIMNGTIVNNSTSSTKTTSAVYVSNGGTTTLRNVKLISNMSGLAVCDLDGNSKSKSATVTIEDDTTVGDNVQYGVYLSSLKATAQKERAVTLNINGGTITGTKNGVYVYGPGSSKYGTVKASITGGTVSDVMVSTGDGPKTPVDIAISGGTITGALTSLGTNEVAISGGTIIGDLKQNGENATISITGGTIGGALNNTNGTITVTGGTFTTADPSDYLADGYEFVNGQVTSSSSTTAITTSEQLIAAIAAANDGDTITLGEGEFTTYGNTSPNKSLTFVGSGAGTIWTIGDLNKHTNGEANGDYSFDGCNTITFKSMKLRSDSDDYRGFIRVTNTVVEDCVLDGKTAYWGYTTASFKDCTFNAPTNDYAIWDYSSPSMTFDNCTFNGDGKAVNVYVEQPSSTERKIEIKNCKANFTKDNKSLLNIKNSNQAWDVALSGTNTVTVNGEAVADRLYQVELPTISEKTGETVKVQEEQTDGTYQTVFETTVKSDAAAKIGEKEYESLEAALKDVTLETPLTWVSDTAWPAATPVYYNGTFYATIGELLYDAQQKKGVITPEANVETAVIYCRPGATIATGSNGAHPSYVTSTTIYGNGAKLAGSTEWDVENYYTLTKDITINLYNLNGGASVWGTRNSDNTVTVNMVNCEDAHEVLFNYGSGNGKVIVTVKNSTFLKSGGAAHGWPVSINCLGSLTVERCTFDGVITGVVVNVKQPAGEDNRTMTVSVKNSTFNNVTGQDGNKGALRVTGQQECDIDLTIADVAFTGSHAEPEDITIGNVKSAENLGKVSYEISGTDASMTVHKTGETEAPKEEIKASETYNGNNIGKSSGDGTEKNPYTLAQLGAMTRAEYIAAQERLGGTMYVTVGDYSYETNGTLGNGTADNSDRDSTKMNYYGAPGAKEGQYSDAAVGKNIVFVGGKITSGVTGYESIDKIGTSLLLAVPAYTNVTFEGTTFKNVMSFNYQLYTSPWSQLGELKFDGCTFNGIIVGAIAAQTLTFNNCNFSDYTNTYAENGKNVGANNSNPIWVRPAYGNWTKGDNEGQGSDFKSLTAINFTGNTVTSTRPVKFERIAQWEMDTTVTVTGNSFDIKDTGEKKNVGLYFGANAKFDLVVEGNTKNGSTAALYTAVYSAPNGGQYAGLPAGSTVKDSKNTDITLTDALEWKSTKKLTLKTTEEVAELSTTDSKNNHVTVRFATLAAAVKAAKPGDTITLLDNIKLTAAQTISKKLTIDLNGKTLDSTVYQTIKLNAGADLTVMDSGTNGKITNSYAPGSAYPSTIYLNEPKTAFTLVSGTIESDPNETSLQSVAINSKKVACTVNIQGGSVVVPAGATEGRSIVAGKDMTLNISGGTITGGLHGVDAYGGSTVNITGGKVTATYVDTGVIKEAYGMRIIGTANVTINGGEIQGIKMDDDGYKLDVPNVTLVSGKVNGSFYSITKGTIVFTVDPTATITFENDTVKNFLPSTVELVRNEDGTYGVTKKVTYVAEVNGKQYDSLQAAIDAAPRKGTVKLLADTRENVTIDKMMTLDLNGHTLNGGTEKGKPALTITARTVTIKDSSAAQTGTIMREDTAENSGVSSHYVIDIQGNAWVMFESGNVKNNSGNTAGKGASLVRVGDDSVEKYPGLNIKGGTFTQDNFIAIKVDRGDLFLNGGTLNSKNSYAIENWHRATIKGGTVNGAVSSWTYGDGSNSTLEINGGTVNGNVEAVSYDGAEGKLAKVEIKGGTVNGTLSTKRYGYSTTDPAKATIEVTAGTFSQDPSKYLVEGSTVTNNSDGTFGVEKAYLAKVGETSYYTMDEAFKAQTASGKPIVLLRDYTTGSPFNSGTINRTVDLNGHTWTCTGTDANSAAFEINNPNVTLTVKNGKIVSSQLVGLIPSAMGGTIKYDNSGLVFEGVEMSTTATSGIETNGNNTNDSVTLKNSTLNVPNGFGIYFPSSGTLTIENSTINAKTMGVQVCAGSLSINEGSAITVSDGPVDKTENDGAIQDGAAISIVNRTGYKGLGTITVTGGTFTAKTGNAAIKAYNWANNTETEFTEPTKVEVSGGTFSAPVPADLCAPGYVPVDNGDGIYGVKEGTYVAAIGEKKYATLAAAVDAAQNGDTITLLADVEQNTMLVIKKDITLDLAGKKIFNTTDIWSDANGSYELLSIEAKVTITGNGTIDAKENDCYTINVKNGDLTIENGTFYGNISVVQVEKGTLTINGGKFDLHQKWKDKNTYLINCIDDAFVAKTAKVAIYGGEFVDFDPNVSPEQKIDGKTPSFAAPGVGITKNENNTFTAQADMAAQIVDADGNSVAAYATLKEAVNAAKSGETVIVLKEATVEERITAEANITIDLNQKTVTVADGAGTMLKTTGDVTIKNGILTSAVTANIIDAYGKLKLESVKIYGSTVDGSNLVNVLGNAEVTIDAASEIEADGVGVAVFVGEKSAAKDAKYTLNIYGKVTQKGKSYAISGNGSYPGTSYINIYEGAEVKANNIAEKKDCCAIYQPQAGEINVYGGLVEGYCAIVMKSGTLNISGGTVRGIRNDNVLGDNNSAGNGASYDGSAIVVDSRKTGYAGNVKINVTGGTVESYYSTAIREIGNDSSMTQLVELTVTGGEILGASKNLTNAENDILVRDISVSNVAISGGTFNHEVQADYCAVGYEPSEKDASGMYTVQKVSGNAYYTDDDGNLHYGYLTTLLNNEATVGRVITLIDSVDYKGSLVVEGNRTINLAGYTFESEFYVFVTNGCGIKDSTDGSALIKVAPEKLVFMSNNEQLPIYDSANKGYRLFNCKVKGKCETNGDSATIWVLPEFENKAAYKLLKSGNAHNATISVTISWTGNDGPAAQEFTFKQSLIDIYAAGEGGATFTLRLTGLGTALSGEMSNIKAQSSIKSGAGVSFTGKEYSLSN